MNIVDLSTSSFNRIYLYAIGSLILLSALFPYIQTEVNTRFFTSFIEPNLICNNESVDTSSNLRYAKTVTLNFERNTATVYCIYENSQYNVSLEMEKRSQWKVIFATKLNKEAFVYYPFYL